MDNLSITTDCNFFNAEESNYITNRLYQLYHEAIDPMLVQYENSLKYDINAISSEKLKAFDFAIEKSYTTEQAMPYVAKLREIINASRENNPYGEPDTAIYNIRNFFEKSGSNILYKIFENNLNNLNGANLSKLLEEFEVKYLKLLFKSYLGADSFEKFVEEESWDSFEKINVYLYLYYYDTGLYEVFSKESNRFGDVSYHTTKTKDEIIQEVKKEIDWRREYFNNPRQNDLAICLKKLCEEVILNLISLTSQILHLDLNTEHVETVQSNDTNSSKKLTPAQLLLDFSNAGEFKSNGCYYSFESLCVCLNTNETIGAVLNQINILSKNNPNCATQIQNNALLKKVTSGAVAPYLRGEKPLFYHDNAVIFYGKNGILITDKAIYRIRKNNIRKIIFSELNSLFLDKILSASEEAKCDWYFNTDNNFNLTTIGIDSDFAGVIVALVCLLFKQFNPNKKIQFYNFNPTDQSMYPILRSTQTSNHCVTTPTQSPCRQYEPTSLSDDATTIEQTDSKPITVSEKLDILVSENKKGLISKERLLEILTVWKDAGMITDEQLNEVLK